MEGCKQGLFLFVHFNYRLSRTNLYFGHSIQSQVFNNHACYIIGPTHNIGRPKYFIIRDKCQI